MIHYAPYGPFRDGTFPCGATSGGYTGEPARVTCEGCKAKSPGLWPARTGHAPRSANAMTTEEISALSGRELDAEVARVLGWTDLRPSVIYPGHLWGHLPGQPDTPSLVPEYSRADGPLSPMLAYLDAKTTRTTYPIQIVRTPGGWYCLFRGQGEPGVTGIGETLNAAVCRCVLSVAGLAGKEGRDER
jgi:hypothetical protein